MNNQFAMHCPNCTALVAMKAQCKCMIGHRLWTCCFCGNKWKSVGADNRVIEPDENPHNKSREDKPE